jgi:hypothetical protein
MIMSKGRTSETVASNNITSKAIYVVFRISPDLKPHISIISVGFSLLLYTWEFPPVAKQGAKAIRVALTKTDKDALDYLVKHSGRSAAEVVSAALIHAKNSKVRPQKQALRRSAATPPAKPVQEEA